MKKQDKKVKKVIHLKPIINQAVALVAIIILSALAYEGVRNMIDAKPEIQTAFGILFVLMLVYFATKKETQTRA